ncbi:oligosaccharyl transferase, archaeosortase A system- associated [Lactococcus lactis subsp. lactis]|nr:oligosaccharyl transferase, archaeosortase A system- associated [Lactococcus lactis subsp. lactis]
MKDEVQLKKYLPSLIFAIILPVIAYLFLKMLGNSDTLALGIATAFPVVHMLWSLIRKKELNPVSLVAIIGFLISLLAVYLTHGNNLAFKLWHPILTAAIGTIFLLSVLLDRPLLELASEGENHRKMLIMNSFYGLGFYFSCFVSHFISLFL